jgi:hypothetical protein
VASIDPLTATEEIFWRALMRIVLSLPRRLDSDLRVRDRHDAREVPLTAADEAARTICSLGDVICPCCLQQNAGSSRKSPVLPVCPNSSCLPTQAHRT